MPARACPILGLTLLASLGACEGQEPNVFDLPIAEVHARLKREPLTQFRRARRCGIPIAIYPSSFEREAVKWQVVSDGRDMLWFKAHLSEVSPTRTRVTIEIQLGPGGKERYSGDYFPARPAVVQPVRPAIEEAIAAVLQGREFDVDRAPRSSDDTVCDVQRASAQHGHPISVNDPIGRPGS